MPSWVVPVVYGVGYLWSFRTVAGMVAWNSARSYSTSPDGEDWFFGCFIGFLASIVWPAALLVVYAIHFGKAHAGARLFYTPTERKQEIRQRKVDRLERERAEEKQAYERRISELERAVGIA